MPRLTVLIAFCRNQSGAVALNAGLALLPVMILASFVFDRAHS